MDNGKISRKKLYKYMDIGSDFNILGIKEKLEHILKKIVLFEELYDKLDLLSSESYELSERQLRTRELIDVNIKNNDIVPAYCEFLDYIDDYGKDHNDTINVTELLEIKPALLELKQFILKKYFEVDAKLNDFIIDSNFVERITVKKEEVKWLTEEEVNNLKVKYNNFEDKNIDKLYNEKICNDLNIVELSAKEIAGIPPRFRQNIVLFMGNNGIVIDNKIYTITKENRNEIYNLIKTNYGKIKSITQEQTPEFLSSHLSYNDISRKFSLKLDDENIELRYDTGTESDSFIIKLINDISSCVLNKNSISNSDSEIIKNNDTIKINIFGEEKNLRVFSTGDNKFDENGYYKENPNFELTKEELDMLNWFVNNVKIEDYQKEIVDYCNNSYSEWCDKKITEEELPSEIKIDSIAINIKEKNKLLDEKYNIPEIAFFGECSCDEEHGICIGFKNGKCIGIESQDWIL